MTDARLDRLLRSGGLRAVDVEFAQLIERLDGRGDAVLGLAAAAASQAIARGHSCVPLASIGELLAETDGEPPRALPDAAAFAAALASSSLVGARDGPRNTPLVVEDGRLWLRRYADYERRVAAGLLARARSSRAIADPAAVRARLAQRLPPGTAPDWQAVAVALGLRARLAIISGGPGTGKTTCVLWLLLALLESAEDEGRPLPRIRLAAPTGKAAARLGESLRERKAAITCSDAVRAAIREDEASTLHRLLGYRPHHGFRHDRAHPLAADVVVVDEASMVDLPLMAHLLDALDEDTALVLLGDVGQLASVEAGHVLASIGARGEEVNRYTTRTADALEALCGQAVPRAGSARSALADAFVELRHNHRFGGEGGIARLARAIREGEADAALALLRDGEAGVAWMDGGRADLARSLEGDWRARLHALCDSASAADALALAARFRLLTALREGPFGCVALNRALEAELADASGWYHGRLVMITANDYRHHLFNGDVGIAWRAADGRLDVWFEGEAGVLRAFSPYTLPSHESAFAMTVHKSQGSEFDQIALVLPDRPGPVLGRELVYTAVTRAREGVLLHAGEAILREAIARRIERWSGLPDLLRGG